MTTTTMTTTTTAAAAAAAPLLLLRIVPNPTFWAPVRITVPGQAQPAQIELQFRHLGKQALRGWVESGRTPNPDGSLPTDVQWLGQVVADWRGPVDEGGRAETFAPAAFAAVLDAYATAGPEIYSAYLAALSESRAKN